MLSNCINQETLLKYLTYALEMNMWSRADSTSVPSLWETSLQSNAVSHWLVANVESALWSILCAARGERLLDHCGKIRQFNTSTVVTLGTRAHPGRVHCVVTYVTPYVHAKIHVNWSQMLVGLEKTCDIPECYLDTYEQREFDG